MQNTLNYVKMLEEKGMPKEQAETTVSVIFEMVDKKFATKHDLDLYQINTSNEFEKFRTEMAAEFRDVRSEMRNGFKEIRTEMETGFKEIRTEMDHRFSEVYLRFDQLETRLTVKLGTMMASGMAVMIAILKLT